MSKAQEFFPASDVVGLEQVK